MTIMNKMRLFTIACLMMPMLAVSAAVDDFVASNDSVKTTADTLAKAKVPTFLVNPASIIDEVVWVVGDEAILRSDIEAMRLQAEAEGVRWDGDPECVIPEQLAVQKLFLHQAAIDSIEVAESDVSRDIEDQINYWIQLADGSREKLEEYRKQTIAQMRQQMHDEFKNRSLVQKMKQQLVKDVTVSPAEVRRYFERLPEDSIPLVPTTVEVQIITRQPKVGFMPKSVLDPAFASVAFNLTDPNKISKIVESEFGYHIIQLIDKRGERINVRHILLKPSVSQEALDKASAQLDSIANDIRDKKFTFEEAATYVSDDKDTKSNHGLMGNLTDERVRTSKFRMQDLPTEVARAVEQLQVGEISKPFEMINARGKKVCAIIKLKSRVESHRATITEDFQTMKDVVLAQRREQVIKDWTMQKIKNTYVRINDRYKDCQFQYQGWVK